MTHNQYLSKMLTKKVNEPGFKYECVALAKDYANKVLGIKLGSFNGAAKNATYKKGGTFDPDKWIKITPGPTEALKQSDILIQSTGDYGHVGVVDRQYDGGYLMLDQNSAYGNGSGWGLDAILLKPYDYSKPILNFYRKK